ncbi:TetR/AcrR family transcriptional regulator [Saccharopolyspora sp. 5N708]|uniref:TetR/AcrR family transcriptional regulator n=1 Tax=Saccharopolyspora sp. 5N708 TaxID=3457424 RepID=UPI003FD1CA65
MRHDDPKLGAVMTAALGVFGRYGFKKTSMDAVAKAANISRPGLYLLFSSKDELYRATMQGVLQRAQDAAETHLADETLSFERRIVEALDELIGQYVETQVARDIDQLLESSEAQLGSMLHDYQEKGQAALGAAITSLAPPGVLTEDLTADQVTDILFAASLSWKHQAATRTDFRDRVGRLVRLICRAAD